MPLIKSAIKKLRKDRKRTIVNKAKKETLKGLIKNTWVNKNTDTLKAVFSALDKAVKTNLIQRNKASRLKSRLSRGIPTTNTKKVKKVKKKIKKLIKNKLK